MNKLLLAAEVNASGLIPVDHHCLVRIDKAEEVSKGGIVIPEKQQEREQWAETRGTLVAVGGSAFYGWVPQYLGEEEPRLPQPGDRVMVRQYNVYRVRGTDGQYYSLVEDRDILLIVVGECIEQK